MNVVVWTRVSSAKQEEEGYSIDAQLRTVREKAQKENWTIVREFTAAESAKKGAERKVFNEMMDWVQKNAKSMKIEGLLAHKLDRTCRNMKDAVRLRDMDEKYGVKLYYTDSSFDPTPSGQLNFNIQASFAQYYSDNLKNEPLKGLNEKANQGWLPCNAPYGYINDSKDKSEPIKVDPAASLTVPRLFELYSTGTMTYQKLADTLHAEGLYYKTSVERFTISNLTYILNNRFYIGQILWHGRILPGKHKPIVDVLTFERCQEILQSSNHRKREVNLPLAGGLFRCAICGHALAGEVQFKKQKDGTKKEHHYYRCCNRYKGEDHPVVSWSDAKLEAAIVSELRYLKLPSPEVTEWFRKTIRESLQDETTYRKDLMAQLRRKETELENKKSRLLDLFIGGGISREDYEKKSLETVTGLERVRRQMAEDPKVHKGFEDMAVKVFDMSQNAAETYLGSCNAVKRELLEIFCTNRKCDSTSLMLEWRCPFLEVIKMAKIQTRVDNWILHVPKVREFVSSLRSVGFGHILKAPTMVA